MAKSVCQIEEDGKVCGKPARCRGMCQRHYKRWQVHGDPLHVEKRRGPAPKPKSQCPGAENEPCGRVEYARGLCQKHYNRAYQNGTLGHVKRVRRPGEPVPECSIDGCGKLARSYGYCMKHAQRHYKHGDPHFVHFEKTGEFRKGADGYMRRVRTVDGVPTIEWEHRVVMERVLGRKLLPGENVHHIDGDRTNNRPENLELWTRSQPSGQRVEDKIVWALEFLETYAPHYLAKDVQIALPLRR